MSALRSVRVGPDALTCEALARVNLAIALPIGLLGITAPAGMGRTVDPYSELAIAAVCTAALCYGSAAWLLAGAVRGRVAPAAGLLTGFCGGLLVAIGLAGMVHAYPYAWRRFPEVAVTLGVLGAGIPAVLNSGTLLLMGGAQWRRLPEWPRSIAAPRVLAPGIVMGIVLIGLASCGVPIWQPYWRCIVEGMTVDTPRGPRAIEDVRVGDSVWSRDAGGERRRGTVVRATAHRVWRHHRVVLQDGRVLRATATHPVLVDGVWVRLGELDGAAAVATASGPTAIVEHAIVLAPVQVFDLSVEPHDNFFVGGVLVHNKSRIGTNETSTIGSLRSLARSQAEFKAQGVVDQDGDGVGEYGWLGELSGNQPCRTSGRQFNASPFIAQILGVRDASGIAQKSGYMFRMYLRDATGTWRAEPGVRGTGTPLAAPVDPKAANGQETAWIAYAWPNCRTQAGNRVFMVNQAGDVYASSNTGLGQQYSGTTTIPAPEAAFTADGKTIALAAAGLKAVDAGQWVPAGN